jgi:maleylacetoacetate isomerase
MLKLYSYFRSSAAYRVRIALNLKGLTHEIIPVHLLRNGGEQNLPEYRSKNPLALIPALDTDDATLIQSMAILEYLEEAYPNPALLPDGLTARARVRAIAQTVVSEIHPLNNLRVLDYLVNNLQHDNDDKLDWYRHWINEGFTGIEILLGSSPETGLFCHGDTPTLADCCLIPQVYNARRFNCPLEHFPIIQRISTECDKLAAFQNAAPDNQPDAE